MQTRGRFEAQSSSTAVLAGSEYTNGKKEFGVRDILRDELHSASESDTSGGVLVGVFEDDNKEGQEELDSYARVDVGWDELDGMS